MRVLAVLVLIAVALRAGERGLADVAAGEGIAWTADVKRTLALARRDGRPILVAINALDQESGNRAMAFQRYRDRDLVAATRPFLCLVASPSNHLDREKKTCTRFGRIPCSAHQEVLNWALLRWGRDGNLVSPQHMIVAPDGSEVWRQEFWIDADALQRRLELVLKRYAPRRTLELAANTRETPMERLAGGADPTAYFGSGDPLAAAVLLLMYEETEETRWLEPLKKCGEWDRALIRLFLEDDAALVPIAKAIDAKWGGWWKRYHGSSKAKVPPPHDPKLAAAWKKLKKGDRAGLDALLGALDHPVDGPEVRACLATLAGRDYGRDVDAWKEYLPR